jgi:hypothetical protein
MLGEQSSDGAAGLGFKELHFKWRANAKLNAETLRRGLLSLRHPDPAPSVIQIGASLVLMPVS